MLEIPNIYFVKQDKEKVLHLISLSVDAAIQFRPNQTELEKTQV